ncbi:MAG: sulfotransferase, partial [Pseudomonadota bacterium]
MRGAALIAGRGATADPVVGSVKSIAGFVMTETTAPSAHTPAIDRPVFIIATARSGTTLLQRYLNLSPELVIWGEHAGFLNPLQQSLQRLTSDAALEKFQAYDEDTRARVRDGRPIVSDAKWTIEWLNPFTRESILGAYRAFLSDLFSQTLPPGVRWGFKEVQYGLAQVRMLAELFPEARFVCPLREPFDIIVSKVRAFTNKPSDNDQLEIYIKQNQRFLDLLAALDKRSEIRSMSLLLDELQSQPESVLARVAAFLDVAPLPNDKIAD